MRCLPKSTQLIYVQFTLTLLGFVDGDHVGLNRIPLSIKYSRKLALFMQISRAKRVTWNHNKPQLKNSTQKKLKFNGKLSQKAYDRSESSQQLIELFETTKKKQTLRDCERESYLHAAVKAM